VVHALGEGNAIVSDFLAKLYSSLLAFLALRLVLQQGADALSRRHCLDYHFNLRQLYMRNPLYNSARCAVRV
jgi:hypothetical protein